MNTANLQLEGLCMAMVSLVDLLKDRDLISADEVDLALARAETAAASTRADLSPANCEAIGFPIRLLRLANRLSSSGESVSFNELARRVGEAKDRRAPLDDDETLSLATALEEERDA